MPVTQMIIGHKKQIKFLEDVLKSENTSQAYLFIGPEGVGKFSIAKLFADSLSKGLKKIDQKKLTDTLKNPDVDILEPETVEKKGVTKIKNIEVESVRNSQKNLSLYPLNGEFRVLIINNAHGMNIASQNSILKTLEEPNATSIIILVTHEEGAILDTIKSRCQSVNFNLVSLDDIREGFRGKIDEKIIEKITIFSIGRPGEVERIINNKESLKERDLFIKDLGALVNMNLVERLDLAERYSKNIPKTTKILEFWIWFLRVQTFRNLKDDSKTRRYYKLIKKIDRVLEKLKNPSLNGRLILENLFLEI